MIDEKPEYMAQYVFPLRRNCKVTITLPVDLSAKDVKRMMRWLEILPVEEEPEPEAKKNGSAPVVKKLVGDAQ